MKRILFLTVIIAASVSFSVSAPGTKTYFPMDEMPDLIKCLPAPPQEGTPAFDYDVSRYEWGKAQRADSLLAAMADRDAIWSLDTLLAIFSEPFGYKISKEYTPKIYEFFCNSVSTIEQIRVRPKAYFHRQRPFEHFGEHILTTWEENDLRGEGSYPSGHTIRGWSAALLLAEINPAAAEKLYARGWKYGESRVIVGAHWQSDVDVSRNAAAIAFAKIQTSKDFQKQMCKARKEFNRISGR